MGKVTFQDVVGAFRASKEGVSVLFLGHAAEYVVRRENENLGRIVGALAAAWAKQAPIGVSVNGTTIVDASEN